MLLFAAEAGDLRYGWVRTLTICADPCNLWENILTRRNNLQHIVRIHIVSFAQSREAETIVLFEHMHHELGAVERLRRGVVEVDVERHLLLH